MLCPCSLCPAAGMPSALRDAWHVRLMVCRCRHYPPLQAAESLLERSRREGWGHWAYSSTAAPQPSVEQWEGWAGLHSPEPAPVPGLESGVAQVSLGTAHALALLQ